VRFGGPEYTTEQLLWALLAANQVTRIFESRSLRDATEQLDLARRQAQLQDDFIATISHELHTPLGFIKGYTTSLLRPDISWDEATQREFLTIIDEESDQLIMLIDRMLDSARLQSGNLIMDFQPMRLEALLHDVVIRMQGRHKDLEVSLDLEPAPPIQADTVRISQVFNNFFDNAIKYAPGAAVEITLRADKKNQVITFTDHGPGIPVEHIPYLFDRFYRAPNGNNRRGTGLGLFICKQIIQAHNGRISVKTIPGKGTSFHIELPSKPAAVSPER
jgi:signal transduction histidine kinase